jgi:hypothetical protein
MSKSCECTQITDVVSLLRTYVYMAAKLVLYCVFERCVYASPADL